MLASSSAINVTFEKAAVKRVKAENKYLIDTVLTSLLNGRG